MVTFHSLMVSSMLPVASTLPSRLNATVPTALAWPDNVVDGRFHKRTVSSPLPEASVYPSGLNATE